MAVNLKAQPGDVYEVPLPDGYFGYGKYLPCGEVAFLDFQSEDQLNDTDKLDEALTLFRIWVANHAFSRGSHWRKVGTLPILPMEEVASCFFKKDKLSGKLSIYQHDEGAPKRYREWGVSYDECIGLERAAAWEPKHVESRLTDHFAGRENVWVKQMALSR